MHSYFIFVVNYFNQVFFPSTSRQAGHRFGEHLQSIVPLVVKFCRNDDDELREYCLQAFESFVRRCPKEVSPFIPEVSNEARWNVKHANCILLV